MRCRATFELPRPQDICRYTLNTVIAVNDSTRNSLDDIAACIEAGVVAMGYEIQE